MRRCIDRAILDSGADRSYIPAVMVSVNSTVVEEYGKAKSINGNVETQGWVVLQVRIGKHSLMVQFMVVVTAERRMGLAWSDLKRMHVEVRQGRVKLHGLVVSTEDNAEVTVVVKEDHLCLVTEKDQHHTPRRAKTTCTKLEVTAIHPNSNISARIVEELGEDPLAATDYSKLCWTSPGGARSPPPPVLFRTIGGK
jgi:hypothetical protein